MRGGGRVGAVPAALPGRGRQVERHVRRLLGIAAERPRTSVTSGGHCSICSSQVLVVLSPWLVSVLVNGVTRQTSGVITQSGQSLGFRSHHMSSPRVTIHNYQPLMKLMIHRIFADE